MASSLFLFPFPVKHHRYRHTPPKHNPPVATAMKLMSFSSSSSSEINLHPSFLFFKRNPSLSLCHAASSPPEPPSEDQIPQSSGVSPKDKLQIFFSVLFWMSLFFWSCVWDRGDSGRPNKGSGFRK